MRGVAGLAFHAQLDWDWTFAAITLVAYPIPGILVTAGRGTTPARSLERWMAGAALPLLAVLAIACTLPLLSERAKRTRKHAAGAEPHGPGTRRERPRGQPRPALDRGAARPRDDPAAARPAHGAAADVRRALRLEPANADTWLQAARCEELLERPQGRVQERANRARACALTASTLATMTQYCTAKAGTTG